MGAVAGVVGIESGVVSGVINLESPGVGAPGRRPRHDKCYTKSELLQGTTTASSRLFDDWFDPIETRVRDRVVAAIGHQQAASPVER
jgi:hypothetical protein